MNTIPSDQFQNQRTRKQTAKNSMSYTYLLDIWLTYQQALLPPSETINIQIKKANKLGRHDAK
jgi:hypothetical protein